MKKTLSLVFAFYFIATAASISISAGLNTDNLSASAELSESQTLESTYEAKVDKSIEKVEVPETKEPPVLTATLTPNESQKSVVLNRGGDAIPKNTDVIKNSVKSTKNDNLDTNIVQPSKSKVETLSWSQARNIFSNGSVAVVQDVYTGKTFTIKRTMGTNHADAEAVSKADTEIIKSVWGGLNWNRRPVIVTIGGRRLAASMTSMPHAGLDSAPALSVINNRSDGYGRGQNLDIVKGNGMDGHFDVHFLNSTRHKDGQVDSAHQAAIKIAGSK